MWDYAPSHIDGFRAYSIPLGTNAPAAAARTDTASGAAPVQQAAPTPVATQTNRLENGSVATLVVLEPRPRGFANECFGVTAFAGGQESPISATVCVPPVGPMGEGRALHKD